MCLCVCETNSDNEYNHLPNLNINTVESSFSVPNLSCHVPRSESLVTRNCMKGGRKISNSSLICGSHWKNEGGQPNGLFRKEAYEKQNLRTALFFAQRRVLGFGAFKFQGLLSLGSLPHHCCGFAGAPPSSQPSSPSPRPLLSYLPQEAKTHLVRILHASLRYATLRWWEFWQVLTGRFPEETKGCDGGLGGDGQEHRDKENQEAYQSFGIGSWQRNLHDLAHHASQVRVGSS